MTSTNVFDNLSGSHHQSHVNYVSSVYGIYVSGQLSRDVIGCFKSNRWLSRVVIGCGKKRDLFLLYNVMLTVFASTGNIL